MKTAWHIIKTLLVVAFFGWLAMTLSGCPDDGEDGEELNRRATEKLRQQTFRQRQEAQEQIHENRLFRHSLPHGSDPGLPWPDDLLLEEVDK